MNLRETNCLASRRWQFAWCEFKEQGRRLIVHGQLVKIEPKQADVLIHLLEDPLVDHSNDELLGSVWSHLPNGADDASLTTAIRKLRQAFGGERDAIILNTPRRGYRIAVPVAKFQEPGEAALPFRLAKGDGIPFRPGWTADRLLGPDGPHPVWLAENKFHEARVFKFATTLPRLRALERERTVSRYLYKALPGATGFIRLLPDSNLEQEPFFLESEFGGDNLLDWSASEHFAKTTVAERISIAAQLVEAVAAAHSLGILHNDLKPSNVLILRDEDGEADWLHHEATTAAHPTWSVRVIDFGLARLTESERLRQLAISRHGFEDSSVEDASFQGTYTYLAPEMQAPGAVPKVQGDVYALGVLLYQLVCGDFVEPPISGWESRIADELLREVIANATHRDPNARTATAAKLADGLRSLESRRAKLRQAEQEARERAADAARAEMDRRAAERARVRRPWIVALILALSAGAVASLWFAYRARRALRTNEEQTAILESMNHFLVQDFLSQSNPLAGSSTSASQQISLIDAIEQVLPVIDRRFANSPETAGRLHEAIGGALDARTDYAQAIQQFERAAEQFRKAGGELSQAAIIAEFRRENTEMRTGQTRQLADANLSYQKQSALLARLPVLSPEMQAWQAFIFAGSVMQGPSSAQAIPVLQRAVARAEATPGFDGQLILGLKVRLGLIYLHVDEGARAEQIARQCIEAVDRLESVNSRGTFQARMLLQEALFMQGKYAEAITQGTQNVASFTPALGAQNQLTAAALINVAEAEAALEHYPEAIRDEQPIYEMERKIPSGEFSALSTLNDVASYECRSDQFDAGTKHARKVIAEAGAASAVVFVNSARLSLGECLLGQAQVAATPARSKYLSQASQMLSEVDAQAVSQMSGYANFSSVLDVDQARLDFLMGNYAQTRELLRQAAPALAKPQFDGYAKRQAADLQTSLVPIR